MAKITFTEFIRPAIKRSTSTYYDTFSRTFDPEVLEKQLYEVDGKAYIDTYGLRSLSAFFPKFSFEEIMDAIQKAKNSELDIVHTELDDEI